jgi:tight adherence protein C
VSTGIAVLIIGTLTFLGLMSAFVGLFGMRIRVAERLGRGGSSDAPGVDFGNVIRRINDAVRPLGEFVPRSAEEMSKQERKLVQAGIRSRDSVGVFYGLQVAVFLLLILVTAGLGYLFQNPILTLLLCVFGGAALPDIWLSRRTAKRQLAIQHALPDAMDLAVISMEAGQSLDQTLLRISREFESVHPQLAEEFRLHNLEMNLGRTRIQSFRNLAERTGVEDLRALVAILIQTDRFGTSIADALRTFAETLRTKRRQRAEERAAMLPVKMIIPMILFIFPGVGVVILGPALISILNNLLPALAGR